MSKADDVIALADSLIGSPYVYGTWGQRCTPALRKRYAGYNPSQKEITYKRCQVLRPNNPQPNCDGCKYQGMLAFDCRGYTHYCLKNGAGIEIVFLRIVVCRSSNNDIIRILVCIFGIKCCFFE